MKTRTRILLVVLVIIILVVLAAVFFIDSLARKGIEYGTTYATGVTTTLDKLHIGLLAGRLTMGGLQIDNPEGFETPFFFMLGDGEVDVSLGALREGMVEVPTVNLSHVHMYLEKTADGENYKIIMENLKKLKSADGEQADEEQAKGKRFVIREVMIEDVNVDVELFTLGKERRSLKVHIPEIQLSNLGMDSDEGVVLSQMTGILIRSILLAVVQQSGDLLPSAMLNGLEEGLAGLQGLGKVGMQVFTGVGEQLDQVGEQLEEGAKQVGEGVDKAAKDVGEALDGLGDMFKPKEDE